MAKRAILLLIFTIFLISFASAEIIIHNQPNPVYNLGDTLTISATVKSLTGATGTFSMDLLCEGQIINFYKNGVSLSSGGEKKVEASLIFTKNLIGETKGKCKVKGIFKTDYVLTNEFRVSDSIILIPEENQSVFNPGESVLIKGSAITENGEPANGFVELEILFGDGAASIKNLGTINNGFYSVNVDFPKDMESGRYLLKLNAYEEEPGEVINEKTNLGFTNYNIDITQAPTSLEIILDKEVEPGTNAKLKAVLHDQTGKNIASTAKVIVRDSKIRIIEQTEKATDEDLEIPIAYNEKSSVWSVSMESNGLTAEATFLIQEKKDVNISLVNNTLIITNVGNVPYDDVVTVKIGGETVFIDTNIDVDKSKKYKLTAPDGEHQISVLKEEGEVFTLSSFLTGRTVGVKEKTGIRIFSFAWIFIILVLGYVTYLVFKRQHKKTFFGFMPSLFARKEKPMLITGAELPLKNSSKLKSRNPLIVSLSIKGDKQKATAVCLHVKNLREVEKTKGDTEKILQKIIDFAEDNKAFTYENQDYLFFVLAPLKTKTFKNESSALRIAQSIKTSLTEQNRLFKQKIDFGVSINNGEVIMKREGDLTKFTSLGRFIGNSKRLVSLSGEEIMLSREVAEALKTGIKTEQFGSETDAYHIKEIKKHSSPENKKFIDDLVRKWDKEKVN